MSGRGVVLEDLAPNLGQKVYLHGNEIPSSLHGFEVKIYQSEKSNVGETASGKVRVSTITNQNWEARSYHGNMIASNNHYLAYILESRSGHVVRIIQQKTKDRTLLKKFTGRVLDVSFAHANSNLLAVIDQGGNLYIYDLDIANGDVTKISNCMKLNVYRTNVIDELEHRLVWCPYVPQSEDEDIEENLIIAISHGKQAEVYDITEVLSGFPAGVVEKARLKSGVACVTEAHNGAIYDMSLSPDGNVLATGGEDGRVRFWQLNMDQEGVRPSCLHDYQPHGGNHVTRLIFCDNHLTQDPSTQFWRFLITASKSSEEYSEIKIWCTVKWKCLQTIQFLPPPVNNGITPNILLNLDLSASYLFVTDSTKMVLYILPIYQESIIGDASFSSITEYLLTQPILSFVMSGHTLIPDSENSEDEEELEVNWEEFDPRRSVVLIRIHCIQTRSMQELHVRYEPPDLTGIPPPLSSNDSIDGGNSYKKSMPPPLEDDITTLPPLEDSFPSHNSIPYAPGQTSASVKLLLPPDSFMKTSPSTSSTTSTIPSSLSTPPSHILRSPSEFESIPNISLIQTEIHTKSETGSHTSIMQSHGDNMEGSLLVAVPLQKMQLSENEGTEEMVVLLSPSATTPNEDGVKLFPSAHDYSNSLSTHSISNLPDTKTIQDEDLVIEDEWPLLKADTSTILEKKDTTPPPLQDDQVIYPDLQYPHDPVITEQEHVSDEKHTAAFVVATAINAAVNIIEKSGEQEIEKDDGMEENIKEDEHVNTEQVQNEFREEEESGMDEFREEEESSLNEQVKEESSLNEQVKEESGMKESEVNPDVEALEVDPDILQTLCQLVTQQQKDIESLRIDTQHSMENLLSQVENTVQAFSTEQKTTVNEQLKHHYQRVEHLMKEKHSVDSKRHDRLSQTLSQTVTTCVNSAISGRMEKCVRNEMKSNVVPVVQRVLAASQDQMNQIFQQKLISTDAIIQECVRKIVHTEGLVNAISGSVVSSLNQVIHSTSEAVFMSSVLPSFERVCQEMYRQIDEAFKRGTAEYLSQLQLHHTNLQETSIHHLTTSIQSLTSSFSSPTSPLLTSVRSCVTQELNSLTPQLEQSLNDIVCTVIKKEIENILEDKLIPAATAAALQSNIKHHEDRIQTLLHEKQFDTAFNVALSTSDLNLVTYVCQQVSADDVFDSNAQCPLSQPVLLSLIQQLSVDLQDEIELKMKYLELSVLSLDPTDQVTASHLPPVMQLLSEQIVKVEETMRRHEEGSPQLFRAMKRVRMLSEHVCRTTSGNR